MLDLLQMLQGFKAHKIRTELQNFQEPDANAKRTAVLRCLPYYFKEQHIYEDIEEPDANAKRTAVLRCLPYYFKEQHIYEDIEVMICNHTDLFPFRYFVYFFPSTKEKDLLDF
ncbi:uncharacterized protein [Apostichopus japonicus]|uniref:uncharacterized protein n=1 Tax=Stichopus japonicus TaxID=307972 RepID=UPI003AB2E310